MLQFTASAEARTRVPTTISGFGSPNPSFGRRIQSGSSRSKVWLTAKNAASSFVLKRALFTNRVPSSTLSSTRQELSLAAVGGGGGEDVVAASAAPAPASWRRTSVP